MLSKWFTSLLLFSFCKCGCDYIFCQCASVHALCSYVTGFLAHTACITYIPNYMLHVCLLLFPPLQPRVSRHPNAQALVPECFIWPHIIPISPRFMTSGVGLFHQIPRQDTIHGYCVWHLLCFQIWELLHCRRARGVVRRNSLSFQQPTSYLAPSTFTSWKRKKAPGNFYYTLPQLHHCHKTTHI